MIYEAKQSVFARIFSSAPWSNLYLSSIIEAILANSCFLFTLGLKDFFHRWLLLNCSTLEKGDLTNVSTLCNKNKPQSYPFFCCTTGRLKEMMLSSLKPSLFLA